MVVQLHASKQLAQEQCQVLAQENAALTETSKDLKEKVMRFQSILKDADSEIGNLNSKKVELQEEFSALADQSAGEKALEEVVKAVDEVDRSMVRQLVVTYLGGQRKGEARTTLDNVLDVLATMLELSEDDKVAVGLVTKWETEAAAIAKKVAENEAGYNISDAWSAFLSGS